MDRRRFLGAAALGVAAAATGIGCTGGGKGRIPKMQPQTALADIGHIRAVLLHLGHNMWCNYPSEAMGKTLQEGALPLDPKPDFSLSCNDAAWRSATDRAAEKGVNMIVVDLGEGLFYPSHPELAIQGTWSVEKMRGEIARLNALGIEVVPKLNFSTTHNGWMGDYTHMVSSKPYYRMCEEVIADVVEIFGHPRFFHIGCDEERASFQENNGYKYVCARIDEFWWHDLYHLVDTLDGHGVRPWMWSDHMWYHPDFCDRCPRGVVQQNWFYDSRNGGFNLETNNTSELIRLQSYLKLDQAGFDQVPCGSNWAGHERKELGIGADDVMAGLVGFCREHISPEHLMGFMMASWDATTPSGLDHILRGIDLLAVGVM
ncbi:MAG: twin-arginine translocation signal domain-containing protein [Bacteroidales bacterium]|nr:twin-arginine translocation signal domain-containing protein [Bacteroidales bacterium]